ncbi:hypothetical protein LguiA_015093 [Lonicera macranthoides]
MKRHINSRLLIVLIIIFLTINPSQAKPPQPISQILTIINQTLEQFHQWTLLHTNTLETPLKLTPQIAISAFLCFIAASISSAGGIGGGGLFIPILTIVANFDLKAASSFSAFMVTGGSIANVACSMFNSMKFGGKNKALIDYDIALLSEPCMLLGVSIGVICNVVLPEWIITILFAIFLGWSSFRTCRSGVLYWNLETEVSRNGFLRDGVCGEGERVIKSTKVPLLSGEDECKLNGVPWKKLGVLIVVWFLFFFLYLLRGNQYGQVWLLFLSSSFAMTSLPNLPYDFSIKSDIVCLITILFFEQQFYHLLDYNNSRETFIRKR